MISVKGMRHVLHEPAATGHLRSDALANRRRILNAARAVFNEQGIDAEMREVARRAGVGLATIYRGFGTKDGLLTALADQTLAEVLALLAAAEQEADAAQGLYDFLVQAIDYLSANGRLFNPHAGRFLSDPGEVHSRFSAGLRRVLERGVAAGSLRSDLQVDVVEHLIFGALVTVAHSGSLEPHVSGEEFARSVLKLLR